MKTLSILDMLKFKIYTHTFLLLAINPTKNISYTENLVFNEEHYVGRVKLNIDRAKDNKENAGIIKGNEREWLEEFARKIGVYNAYIAELCEVYKGLELAIRLRYRAIEISLNK